MKKLDRLVLSILAGEEASEVVGIVTLERDFDTSKKITVKKFGGFIGKR